MNVDEDSGDEFYKKIIDDKFEELYGKINSSQVIGNPLYNHVKIIQCMMLVSVLLCTC